MPRESDGTPTGYESGRRNKYGAKRVEVDGQWFDSQIEGEVYRGLRDLQERGLIVDLKVHPYWLFKHPNGQYLVIRSPRFANGRKVKYTADFSFRDATGLRVWDVKGMDTDVSRLKRSLMELFHGIVVEVVKHKDVSRQFKEGQVIPP